MQRDVPFRGKRAFQELCRPYWMHAARASHNAEYDVEAQTLSTIGQLPRNVLLLPSRKGRGFAKKVLANLVLPPISTEAAPSSRPVHDSAVPPPPRDSMPSRNDDDECMTDDDDLPHMPNARTRLLKRAISLLKRGHLGRAAKTLFQSDSPRSDDDAIELLRQLHPSRRNGLPVPPGSLPPPIVMDSDRLRSIIKRAATGASPGPSGWTAEHLLVLFEDQACADAITSVISDIVNGLLPQSARKWLLGSRLLALPKKNNGVRPISVGEVLYRLASAYLSDLVSSRLPEIFPTVQKGVGVSGGSDRALHVTQLSLELLCRKCDPVVLAVDVRNAFNCIDRAAIAHAILDHPQLHVLWHFFSWSYSEPSDLLVYDGDGALAATVQSLQGVKQGDPVASLLFALTVQTAFTAAVEGLPDVTATAYLDDLQIVGAPDSAMIAFDRLLHSLPSLGLSVNPDKCACLWPFSDRPAPPQLLASLEQRHIPVKVGFMEVLGGPVGFDREAIRTWCREQITSHDTYFDLLRDPLMSSHHSFLLTKVSLRPKLNHIMRCVPPSIIGTALQRFDRACLDLLSSKVAPQLRPSSLSPFARRQLSFPASYGGLGFPNSSASSLAAFVASAVQAIQDVQGLLSSTQFDPAAPAAPATLLEIARA